MGEMWNTKWEVKVEHCSTFSETLASTDESARRQNPEEQHHHPHRSENLKFQKNK
jgi:hypothetical protein